MKRMKTYEIASFKALGDEGEGKFEAVVSVFGNVDLQGDRVMPGAFKSSLKRLRQKGDPIPVIWSHDWLNPDAHIGWVDPNDAQEVIPDAKSDDKSGITGGLLVKGTLDVHKPFAAQVFDLLKSRRVREWSFAYDIVEEQKGKDGANELMDLDLHEVGPCLKGANPETYTVGAKSAAEAELKEAFEGERSLTKFLDLIDQVGDPDVAKMLTKTYNEGPAELPRRKKAVDMTDAELKAAAEGAEILETTGPGISVPIVDDTNVEVEYDGHKFLVHPASLVLTEDEAKTHGTTLIDESLLEGPVVDDADAKVEGKPWHIEQRGDEYCVIKDSDSSEVACHSTREDAEAQLRALYANESASTPDEGKMVDVTGLVSTTSTSSNGNFPISYTGSTSLDDLIKAAVEKAVAEALKGKSVEQPKPTTEPEGDKELAEINAKLAELLGEE